LRFLSGMRSGGFMTAIDRLLDNIRNK